MFFLTFLVLIQTEEDPQSLYLKTAEIGHNVTLDCLALKDQNIIEILYWHKQSLGYNPQMVVSRYYISNKIQPPFTSRFTVGEGSNFYLTISNVQKEDEGNYFCNQGEHHRQFWSNGVFLTIKGKTYFSLDTSLF